MNAEALSSEELAMLGRFLYGWRWQTAMAHGLDVTPRLVRYWAAGDRQITDRRSDKLTDLVRAHFNRDLTRRRALFRSMISSIRSPRVQTALTIEH